MPADSLSAFLGAQTPPDFEELAWSYEMDPPVARRIDRGFAMLAYLIANQWRGKNDREVPLDRFYPDWDGLRDERDRPDAFIRRLGAERPPDDDEDDAEDLGGDEPVRAPGTVPGEMSTQDTVQHLIKGFSAHGMYAPKPRPTMRVITLDMLTEPEEG